MTNLPNAVLNLNKNGCETRMLNILLSGACGKMGRAIYETVKNDNQIEIIAGVDKQECYGEFPVFRDFEAVTVNSDVIVDFSHVAVLEPLLQYAVKKKLPVVLATTGYSERQVSLIKDASASIPVFFTANMSLGVNLLSALVKKAADVLGDEFDIEIIEKHHNHKLDAPSGTAIMLANSINEEYKNKYVYEYDRHSKRTARSKNEIGIHSVRGGTIVGEHDVIFAGRDEVITLSHSAQSKNVFAAGAVRAAKFIAEKPIGIYNMSDLLNFNQNKEI